MSETFGEFVRRLRNQIGLSQAKLAKQCGLSLAKIVQIERDDKNKKAAVAFRPTTLKLLADGLGLSAGPDRDLLFELAWEREKQKRERKRGIAPLLEPIAGENSTSDIPLNSVYDLSRPLVLMHMDEVADCVISMLAKASKENLDKAGSGEILVTTQGSSSIFQHLGQEKRWSHAIRSVMKDRKWNVVSLYRMTGDMKRAFEVIQEIRNLSIYPSQYIPRYVRNIGAVRPSYNLLIIPRIGALLALSRNNSAVIDSAFFYPDTQEYEPHIRLLTDHFNLLFIETAPLARTYNRRTPEWEDTMTSICQLEADEFLANNCIDSNTMPPDLFDEYLGKAYPALAWRSLLAHHFQRREAFERNVQSFMYRTIMPWRSFEDAMGLSKDAPGQCLYLVSYASGPDQYITVNKSQAILHIKSIIYDLGLYDNYEIALIENHPSVEDLLYAPWLVKGELAVLTAIYKKSDDGKHPLFSSEFELTEPSIVRSYRQNFLTIWGEVADKERAKQKMYVIGKLTELVKEAEKKMKIR